MTLHNLADVRIEAGDHEEAEALLRRALVIKEHAYGPNHLHVADTLLVLAALQIERADNDVAEASLDRALAIWEQAEPPDAVRLAEESWGRAIRA